MDLVTCARELRRHQTDAEKLLWQKLRNRQLMDFKFRRQVPVGPYIVDLVCESGALVVEIDGSQHMELVDYDRRRTAFLEKKGYRVLRFWNNQVLQETEAVLESIALTLSRG